MVEPLSRMTSSSLGPGANGSQETRRTRRPTLVRHIAMSRSVLGCGLGRRRSAAEIAEVPETAQSLRGGFKLAVFTGSEIGPIFALNRRRNSGRLKSPSWDWLLSRKLRINVASASSFRVSSRNSRKNSKDFTVVTEIFKKFILIIGTENTNFA